MILDHKIEEQTMLVGGPHFACLRYRVFIVFQDMFDMKIRTLRAVSDVSFGVSFQRVKALKLL